MQLTSECSYQITCNLYVLLYFQIFIILTFQTIWRYAAVRSARAQKVIFLLKLFSVKNCYPLEYSTFKVASEEYFYLHAKL